MTSPPPEIGTLCLKEKCVSSEHDVTAEPDGPVCLDCGTAAMGGVGSDKYPKAAFWSRCYLCAFCRTHRYKSEAHAIARVRAAFERAEQERMAPCPHGLPTTFDACSECARQGREVAR